MSKTKDSKPAVYFNLKYNESGSPVIDHSESPDLPTARVHPYVNLPISEKSVSHSPSPQNHSPEKTSPVKVSSPTKSTKSGEEAGQGGTSTSPLRRHLSETGFRLSGKDGEHNKLKTNGVSTSTPLSSASPTIPAKQAMANAKFDLLTQQAGGGVAKGKGCDKCDELVDLLASWQIGAGSLMRNYSRILALLTQTRDSALALECRLGEQQSLTDARPSSAPPNGKQQFAQVTGGAIINGSLRPQSAATIRDDNGLSRSSKGATAATVSRGGAAGGASSPQHAKKAGKNRQSMFVSSSGATHTSTNFGDLGENMYPKREEELVSHQVYSPAIPTVINPASYTKDMEELKKNLWDAIDLCQQLAAACFKKTHLANPSGSESKDKPTLQGQQSALPVPLVPLSSSTPSSDFLRKHSEGSLPQAPQFKSTLHTIRESKAAGERERKRRKREGMERVTSAPSLECSSEVTSSGEKDGPSAADDEGYVHVTAKGIPDSVTKAADVKSTYKAPPLQNGVDNPETAPSEAVNGDELSANSRTRMRNSSLEDTESESASDRGMSPISGDDKGEEAETEGFKGAEMEGNERSASMLSGVSTYTDSDVKYVMSKIASLEEERYRLLETIDKLHNENSNVRLSLHELLSDLDNKDLQLTLAMQDLSIATEEIRKAAEMRRKLKSLSGERDSLLERLEALEDESSAVKVSLIQLLQEKSATNKTLVLENWRLTQKAQSQAQRPGKNSTSELTVPASPSSPAPASASGGDNISIRSGYSATTDDSAIQEAVMGADMIENFVHKQGFLVKQGGRVKNWRKRLFVLNTDGLSYYKTEQPIQTVPISKIEKVQLCHGRCPQPHMFEVHTRNRVFYLSASSADEMQSWVGMLETLKQYRRTATMHAKLMSKAKVPSASIPPVPEVITSGESSQPPHSATSEEEEGVATAITASSSGAAAAGKTLGSSYEDGESDEEEHVTLHQQPAKRVSHGDIDDEDDSISTYPIELRTEYALSAPEESSMMKSRTSMSGKILEGLDLSNL